MKLAISVGIPISEFWEMTPLELNLVAKHYFEKEKREHEERVILAYLNAAWTIQWLGKKKDHPKPLSQILGKKEKAMTDDEMFQQVKLLNKVFKGEEK